MNCLFRYLFLYIKLLIAVKCEKNILPGPLPVLSFFFQCYLWNQIVQKKGNLPCQYTHQKIMSIKKILSLIIGTAINL